MPFYFSFSSGAGSSLSSSSSTASSSSSSSLPIPQPPTPTNNLLDITPRKSSFSTAESSSCAFPSWPNRSSLFNSDSGGSAASSHISDEDLWPTDMSFAPCEAVMDEESVVDDQVVDDDDDEALHADRLVRFLAQEEEHRVRFLAQVQAKARAYHAMRAAQVTTVEKDVSPSKRTTKKSRPVHTTKRRGTSSSTRSKPCVRI